MTESYFDDIRRYHDPGNRPLWPLEFIVPDQKLIDQCRAMGIDDDAPVRITIRYGTRESTMPDTIRHITVNTGHERLSPRSEVSQEAIDACLPLTEYGKHLIPGFVGYSVETGMMTGGNLYFGVFCGDVKVVVGVVNPKEGRVSVTLQDTPALLDGCLWLGDFERCLAWAWIERQNLKP